MIKNLHKGRILDFLYSFLIIVGFAILGSVIGIVIGYLLYFYAIPPWSNSEIDREGKAIDEIIAVDVHNISFLDLAEVELILKTVDGEYISYFENQWQPVDIASVDINRFNFEYRTCDDLITPPLFLLFQSPKDSFGIGLADTATFTSEDKCYILRTDGRLFLWERRSTWDDMLNIVVINLILWTFIGGLVGGNLAKRRSKKKALGFDERVSG